MISGEVIKPIFHSTSFIVVVYQTLKETRWPSGRVFLYLTELLFYCSLGRMSSGYLLIIERPSMKDRFRLLDVAFICFLLGFSALR